MAPKVRQRKPPLEVVSQQDGAWYDGGISMLGGRLRIHFSGFGTENDEFWDEEILKNPTKFKKIVRLRSEQLQDWDCTKVQVGTIVCANFKTFDGTESKYYDAKVLMVHHSKHSLRKNDKGETCHCRFRLAWESGPHKHREVYLGCPDISLIRNESVGKHPVAYEILQSASSEIQREDNEQSIGNSKIQLSRYSFPKDGKLLEDDNNPMGSRNCKRIYHSSSKDLQQPPLENHSLQNSIFQRPYYNSQEGYLFTSQDLQGLPEDIIQKVRNYSVFHKFLGEETQKLKESLDKYKLKNNFP